MNWILFLIVNYLVAGLAWILIMGGLSMNLKAVKSLNGRFDAMERYLIQQRIQDTREEALDELGED